MKRQERRQLLPLALYFILTVNTLALRFQEEKRSLTAPHISSHIALSVRIRSNALETKRAFTFCPLPKQFSHNSLSYVELTLTDGFCNDMREGETLEQVFPFLWSKARPWRSGTTSSSPSRRFLLRRLTRVRISLLWLLPRSPCDRTEIVFSPMTRTNVAIIFLDVLLRSKGDILHNILPLGLKLSTGTTHVLYISIY